MTSFNESKDVTYSKVPLNLLYNNKDGIVYNRISDSTIKRILSEFPGLSVDHKIVSSDHVFCHSKRFITTFMCNFFKIDVYEVEDEWFYLEVHFEHGGHYAWKCDQLQGVFDCIRGRGVYLLEV